MASDPWEVFDSLALAEPEQLSQGERWLLSYGWLRTEVNNGGFDQYFFNSAGDSVLDVVDALQQVGPEALLTLVRAAMDTVGSVDNWTDRSARQAALEAGGDPVADRLVDLSEAYYDIEATDDLDAAMAGLMGRPGDVL